MMSELWPLKPLGEVCSLANKLIPFEGDIPYYSTGDVNHDGSEMVFGKMVTMQNKPSRAGRTPGIGCVGFAKMKGTIKVIRIDDPLSRCVFSTGFSFLQPNEEILTDFLYYYLLTNQFHDEKNRLTSDGIMGSIKDIAIKSIKIPVPPLEEQQRIVSILDEALENSKSMLDERNKKLLNSVELFRSLLCSIFDQSQGNVIWNSNGIQFPKLEVFQPLNEKLPSSTRGRKETERTIEGRLSLSVGLPSIIPRKGWSWSKLTNLARLESGHTPSRRFPEYWGGDVPWIGIKDARNNYGKILIDTLEQTNELGIANSAARLLPKGTVCLSRTASVGYVVVMGTEMATSQDFVNWVCTPELDPHFLKFLLMAERDDFTNYSSGSVHQTIYFPEVKAFHICHPDVDTQRRIAEYLNGACLQIESLQELYKKEIEVMEQLGQSILQDAFTGKLTGGITA